MSDAVLASLVCSNSGILAEHPKHISVVGHSEGGSIALLAAAKDRRIAGVGLIATPGVPGAEIVLAQQRRLGTADRNAALVPS